MGQSVGSGIFQMLFPLSNLWFGHFLSMHDSIIIHISANFFSFWVGKGDSKGHRIISYVAM